MSHSRYRLWSNNPNAPKIPYHVYLEEKAYLAGTLIGSMLYGMLIVLFFKCMTALLSSAYHRGEGIKWNLVSYTVVMFSWATVLTGMDLDIQSISHIDNREFTGPEGLLPSGPLGYFLSIYLKPINVIPNAAFVVGGWLADGFLLHRCYVVYATNLWIIAFPCLMYLGSVAMGIVIIYPFMDLENRGAWAGLPYFSISLSLNIILTLMTVLRLVLHGRNIRAATGSPAGISGLYNTIATMLIESSALFAVSSVLYIGLLAGKNEVMDMFSPIIYETQVIAPLLIIQRVASKSALTSDTILTGGFSSFNVRSQGESTGDSGIPPGRYSMSLVDRHGRNSGELWIGVETTINSRQSEV